MPGHFGVSDKYEYIEYELDSADAVTSPDSSAATTDWPLFMLTTGMNTNIAAIKILEVEIPFTYYIINSTNHTFQMTENSSNNHLTVTIPVGNYTSTSLATAMQTAMNSATTTAQTYAVAFSSTTGKFTITNTTAGGTTFTLVFGTDSSDLGETNPRLWLGFNGGNSVASLVGGVYTVVAQNACLITGPNYLYVNSNFMGGAVKCLLPEQTKTLGSSQRGQRVARIPVNVQPGGIINWQDPNPFMWFDVNGMSNLNAVDFYITLGNLAIPSPLPLNGSAFSIKVGILLNRLVHHDFMGGSVSTDRVQARARPNGTGLMPFM